MTEKATLQKLRAMENKLGTLEEGQKSLIEGHQASMEQITMNNNNNYSSLKQEVIALKNSMADLVEMMKAQLQTKQKVDVAEESLKFKDNNSELLNSSLFAVEDSFQRLEGRSAVFWLCKPDGVWISF